LRTDVREGQNWQGGIEKGAELDRQMGEGAVVRKRKCERGENVREGKFEKGENVREGKM
jgi:hypothetical protein